MRAAEPRRTDTASGTECDTHVGLDGRRGSLHRLRQAVCARDIEWGSGALIDWMEDYCEDFLALVIRALSIVVVWGCLPASPTQDSGRD